MQRPHPIQNPTGPHARPFHTQSRRVTHLTLLALFRERVLQAVSIGMTLCPAILEVLALALVLIAGIVPVEFGCSHTRDDVLGEYVGVLEEAGVLLKMKSAQE